MSLTRTLTRRVLPVVGISGLLVAGTLTGADASSHREAPLITEDPVADLTDVYAFVSPDKKDTITLIADVNPFELPAGGPNFHKFGDDVLYQLNVDNDGDSVADLEYRFTFRTSTANPNTFLYNTGRYTSLNDADLNVKQVYDVVEVNNDTGKTTTLGTNLPVAPANVGPRSSPDYEKNLGSKAVVAIQGGVKSFAGPRDDPFFVDLGSIFDLGGLRPFNQAHVIPLPKANGKDYVKGFNVHTYALQVPKSRLVANDKVIGVWASTFRRANRVLSTGAATHSGPWVQVARLGQPLVNEVVIPLGLKDAFNGITPSVDRTVPKAVQSVLDPELGRLIPVLYPGVKVPKSVDLGLGLGGREDLATIFLTGIPGLNQPKNVVPSEMLRLNTDSTVSSFPNGRWLADDVTDTEIRAVAGATAFTPDFNKAPNNQLGDGVNKNDRPFLDRFPYLASPASGYFSGS
jgi:hypothetical protein